MRLFHHPISSNARRALMTAKLLGVPLELTEVNLMDPDDRRRLAEINPNCKVPVLQDGALMLWESCAIMQYLADCTPSQTLYPQDPAARADVNRWMFWACQHFAPAVGVLTWERVWKGKLGRGGADPLEVARGEQELGECAAVLEQHLAGREWIAGKALSLADIAVAPPLMYAALAQLPIGGYPNLLAWFERVKALDAWKETDVVFA